MTMVPLLARVNRFLLLIIFITNLLLYCYPLFRGASNLFPFGRAPIRLLILADPHLEGDSKIARMGWRGRLDIWGNDRYLGHIHSMMRFFVRPTHTVILGDHMSSQWIDDAEFATRCRRMEKNFLKWHAGEIVFNITGNHDIGYAGDITQFRLDRWNQKFGSLNYETEIDHGIAQAGPLRIIGLNDLLLDGPALHEDLRGETHRFLANIPRNNHTTILLTHVPMHKETGVCVDSPHMSYYDHPRISLREQNHLSPESTKTVLDHLFATADGIVVTGHDHEGCHVIHKRSASENEYWSTERFEPRLFKAAMGRDQKFVEEVTVRSIMGQYGGNSGVLTGRWDNAESRWKFDYLAVPFVHNTIWWIVHIITTISLIYLLSFEVMQRLRITSRGKKLKHFKQTFD